MKKVVLFIMVFVAMFISTTVLAEEYNVIQLSLIQGAGWCVKTNAPAGKAVIMVKPDKVVYGVVQVSKLTSGESLVCSDYFAFTNQWVNKFPVTLIYNFGTKNAEEATLKGFRE